MIDSISTERLQEATVYDAEGAELGTVTQVYFDQDTDQPTFVTVQAGPTGYPEILIPLHHASETDDGLQVPFSEEFITGAPRIEADGTLTTDDEDRLLDYYTLDSSVQDADSDADDDSVLVRNEELEVRTERRSSGQARLRKRTTTTTETVQVPVTREEIVLEREPVAPDSAEARAADAGDNEVVVETHEEVPVVTKKVSAEKVRLDTATVQDTETVSETVHHDDVAVDVDRDASGHRENRQG